MSTNDQLISVKQAAEMLGIREESVRAAIAQGRLPCTTITVSRIRLRLKDVEAYTVSRSHQRTGQRSGQVRNEAGYIP